jgi:RNA-directed DNA polymerase
MPSMANDAPDKVRALQRKLYRAAKRSRGRRFHALHDKVHRRDVLERAFEVVARNKRAAGSDGQTIEEIRRAGVVGFLAALEAELREGTYRPLPVRRVRDSEGVGWRA